MLKNDIEKYATEDLALDTILIHTIPARKKKTFVDPYPYDPNAEPLEETQANVGAPGTAETKEEESPYERLLGEVQLKDVNGGDAGCLYKKPDIFPQVFFIRASFVSKLST